jgi:hypothetical protein
MSRKRTKIISKYEKSVSQGPGAGERTQFENSDLNKDQVESMIDQTLADSFPASDPPAWTLGRDQN